MHDPVFDYFQGLALQYDKARFSSSYVRYLHRQEFQFLTQALQTTTPARCLDLACGTGRLLAFADTGLDFSPNMLDVARKKWPGKRLICSDAAAMPFADQSFDAVYALHLFAFLPEKTALQVLGEIHRILTPGGALICDFPSAKRRIVTLGNGAAGRHAVSAYTIARWRQIAGEKWQLAEWCGTVFFPIHRLPLRFRWPLRRADDRLCRSRLKEFASYLLVRMTKI